MSSPRRASTKTPQPALLVGQFDAFYSLLQSLADRLRRRSADADTARTALVDFFEQQENALRPLGAGFLSDIAAPARRAMAVMVDQLLGSDLEWSGRKAWAANPLAPRLVADHPPSDIAAQVSQDVEHLLHPSGKATGTNGQAQGKSSAKAPSQAQKALARVYLEALGLGLTAPFTASDSEDIEHQLFAFLYPQAPTPDQPQLLFPEAYAHTVSHGERALLPTARPWWRILAISGLLLLLISWPIWRDATKLLRDALKKVPTTQITGSAP